MNNSKQEILAIASDLDGTLLHNHKEISPRNYAALKKAHEMGIKLIIASGRMTPSIKKACENIDFPFSIISYNGAKMFEMSDKGWKVEFSESLNDEAVKRVFEFCRENKLLLNIYSDEVLYGYQADGDYKWCEFYSEQTKSIYEACFSNLADLPSKNIAKLLTISNFEVLENLHNSINKKAGNYCTLVKSFPEYLEFIPLGVTKGSTLEKWCDNHKINPKSVVAMGDAENDLEMLQSAGIGIAAQGASQRLKNAWNNVSQWTSEEDFVGRELETILDIS